MTKAKTKASAGSKCAGGACRSRAGGDAAAPGVAEQPISRLRWVHRDSLVANDYNPNHVAPLEMKLLKRSILKQGWCAAITVLADGRTIVDGFHRWTISGDPEVYAMTGGLVPVVTIDADATQRVAATVRFNRARGTHGINPMSDIARGMLAAGHAVEEVMEELGMQREEVLRLSEHRGSPEKIGGGQQFGKAWRPE